MEKIKLVGRAQVVIMRQLGLDNCWKNGLPLLCCYFIEAAEVGCARDLGQVHYHNLPFSGDVRNNFLRYIQCEEFIVFILTL